MGQAVPERSPHGGYRRTPTRPPTQGDGEVSGSSGAAGGGQRAAAAPSCPRPGPAGRTLRRGVLRARTDAGAGALGALTTDERAELRRLRQAVKTLQLAREILRELQPSSPRRRRERRPVYRGGAGPLEAVMNFQPNSTLRGHWAGGARHIQAAVQTPPAGYVGMREYAREEAHNRL